MQIESFYVPPYTLNGDEFPVHIIFEGSNLAQIKVKFDQELTLKEVYNVTGEGYEVISPQELKVKDLEIGGYLGLVLISEIGNIPNKQCNIVVEIVENEEKIIQEKSIHIFRPMLKVLRVPSQISVKYDSSQQKYNVSDKIVLKNVGLGSAIVNINVNDSGTGILDMPENIREFMDGFMKDLNSYFTEFKVRYPESFPIIEEFFQFIGHPELIIEETKNDKTKIVFERFKGALENDESLASDVAEAIVASYLKNIQFITEISSFLDYLNSTVDGKVILTNPVEVLSNETDTFETGFSLGITDLAHNRYPELTIDDLNFEFEGTKSVPLYLLFDWQSDSKVLPRGDLDY